MKHSLKNRAPKTGNLARLMTATDTPKDSQAFMLDVLEQAKAQLVDSWQQAIDKGTHRNELAGIIIERGQVLFGIDTIERIATYLPNEMRAWMPSAASEKIAEGFLPVFFLSAKCGLFAVMTLDVAVMQLVPPVQHRQRIRNVIAANLEQIVDKIGDRMQRTTTDDVMIGVIHASEAETSVKTSTLQELAMFLTGDALEKVLTVAVASVEAFSLPVLFIERSSNTIAMMHVDVDDFALKIVPGGLS